MLGTAGLDARAEERRARERARRAALGAGPDDWIPNEGPQTLFLQCDAFELLFGGAAGPGKSEGLIVDAAKRIHLKDYRALLLRREFPELRRTLLRRSKELYPHLGGRYFAGDKKWVFPSGAEIELGSVPHEDAVERYQGGEYSYLGIDELTHFLERTYLWLFSRIRSSRGIPARVRTTSNPGSRGHDWVLRRWAPWLYPPGAPGYSGVHARPGEVLHFKPAGDDGDEEVVCTPDDPDGLERTFIPGRISDNPYLAGSDYEKRLDKLSKLDRKRLKGGDWLARAAAGEFFERHWFDILDEIREEVLVRIRYWDLAATDEREATPASAFTSGIKLAYTRSGLVLIEDVVRGQWAPGKVEEIVEETAIADLARDLGCMTYIERDPAQAGKFQAWYYATRFPELGIRSVQPQGDKLKRARIPSAGAEQRIIKLLRGDWNEPFLREAEDFPEGKKDQIDGLSGGYRIVVTKGMQCRRDLEAARRDPARRTPGGRHETAALRERRGPGRGGMGGSST